MQIILGDSIQLLIIILLLLLIFIISLDCPQCIIIVSPFSTQILRRFNLSYLNTEPISVDIKKLIITPDKPVLFGLDDAM